jgi:3-deoxy-D-manno-octulosonic-acid transferase
MNTLDALYIALAGLTAPWWARKPRAGWGERLGKVGELPTAGRPRILIHAVSVGEVSALRTLVPLLTAEADVVICATTDTGIARARALFAGACTIVRYPLDFSWSVRRFLDAVRPDAVGLVELEVWPNFIRACRDRKIPVCVINGRLSERSFRGYRRIRRFMAPSFAALEFAAVQDAEYAARFEFMGVAPEACLITGSMKWDAAGAGSSGGVPNAEAERLATELGIDRQRPLIVAGSTGPGEEALLHQACPVGAQLLCAPRKPERFDEAAAAMPGCTRRSTGTPGPGSTRFLLDSIGELGRAYALADIAVVGRSFCNLFGSDPIEPIALGKATIIGPQFRDFSTIVRAFRDGSGIVISDRASLTGDLAALMNDPARRQALARAGLACIEQNRGASRRHAELLLHLAGSRSRREPSGITPAPAVPRPVPS